jgi:hypothetical protein
MTWYYLGKPLLDTDIPPDAFGFLYKITHLTTGRWYIGRKLLTKASTKQINGKKKKIRVESDWRTYWSSSEIIKEQVKIQGEIAFKREILIFPTTASCMTLGEEYLLQVTGAMFDPLCENNNIRAKIYKKWFIKTPNFFNELKSISL